MALQIALNQSDDLLTPARSCSGYWRKPMSTAAQRKAVLDHDEVRRLCGDVPAWKIAAIMALEPTPEEIEEALAWSSGEDDVMASERKQLTGKVAEMCEILASDDEPDDR
jgi:hypothetical protein